MLFFFCNSRPCQVMAASLFFLFFFSQADNFPPCRQSHSSCIFRSIAAMHCNRGFPTADFTACSTSAVLVEFSATGECFRLNLGPETRSSLPSGYTGSMRATPSQKARAKTHWRLRLIRFAFRRDEPLFARGFRDGVAHMDRV